MVGTRVAAIESRDSRGVTGGRPGLRYRTLEGGADVDSVYSFAWLHYALVSLT